MDLEDVWSYDRFGLQSIPPGGVDVVDADHPFPPRATAETILFRSTCTIDSERSLAVLTQALSLARSVRTLLFQRLDVKKKFRKPLFELLAGLKTLWCVAILEFAEPFEYRFPESCCMPQVEAYFIPSSVRCFETPRHLFPNAKQRMYTDLTAPPVVQGIPTLFVAACDFDHLLSLRTPAELVILGVRPWISDAKRRTKQVLALLVAGHRVRVSRVSAVGTRAFYGTLIEHVETWTMLARARWIKPDLVRTVFYALSAPVPEKAYVSKTVFLTTGRIGQ